MFASDYQPVVWSIRGDGLKIDFYADGRVVVLFPTTYKVRLDTGEGPRENTAALYGHVEIAPRPASGTQTLAGRATAPTQYGIG